MSTTRKTPKLRFPEFTDDWEQRKLGELMDVTSVKRIHQSDWTDSGVRFLRARDIVSFFKNEPDEDKLYISRDKYDEYTSISGKVSINDLLVTGVGTIGIPYLITNDAPIYFKDGNIIWFKNNSNINGNFLYYSFIGKGIQDFINRSSGTGTVGTYTIENGRKTPILLPSKKEQQKIGELFKQLDKNITLHQRELDSLKKLKKSLLQKMFPKNGEKIPELRFPEFTGDWEQRKLGDLAEIVGGGTPSTSKDEYWDGEIDWYAPAEIANQIYVESSERKITSEGLNNSSAKMLPVGTVLFTSRAGIGKMAILRKEACTNQGFQSIVPHVNELDSYFIFSRSEELKRYGETVGAGSTFVEVSGKQMSAMPLMMPPTIDEQRKIGEYFSSLDNLITLHQRELDTLKKLKKGLLQNMFV